MNRQVKAAAARAGVLNSIPLGPRGRRHLISARCPLTTHIHPHTQRIEKKKEKEKRALWWKEGKWPEKLLVI